MQSAASGRIIDDVDFVCARGVVAAVPGFIVRCDRCNRSLFAIA
jgi:hypothetical protein